MTNAIDDPTRIRFRYGYVCPATYNKADFVVSILNSGSVMDKKNVKSMCDLSSTVAHMNTKYNAFNKDVRTLPSNLLCNLYFYCFFFNLKLFSYRFNRSTDII